MVCWSHCSTNLPLGRPPRPIWIIAPRGGNKSAARWGRCAVQKLRGTASSVDVLLVMESVEYYEEIQICLINYT